MGKGGRSAAVAATLAVAFSFALAGSGSAGSGVSSSSASAAEIQRQLSTAEGAARYLRSLGVDPRGVVVQRGLRNYAGPNCPGAAWNCTRATRVLQVSSEHGVNSSTCTRDASGPDVASQGCVIVQTSTHGPNGAKCAERATAAAASLVQECRITQTSDSGKNEATVLQTAAQGDHSCSASGTTSQQAQSATQRAVVVQASASGRMVADLRQDATQCVARSGSGAVAQQQTTFQQFTILQGPHGFDPASPSCTGKTGTLDAVARQSQGQSGYATSATSGTQEQRADLVGNIDQCSESHAEYAATQTENQFLAPNGNVGQTQIGPARVGLGRAPLLVKGKRGLASGYCCTFQGTNPTDTCAITQRATQQGNPQALQIEQLTSRADTSGSCQADLRSTQNAATNTASGSGPTIHVTLNCTNGVCHHP